MAEFAEMFEFSFLRSNEIIVIHQSDWKWQWNEYQTEWWTFMNFIINLKQKRMYDFHQSIIWFDCLFNSFIHLSIQTNVKMEKGENDNNDQTQISYLFEGSYKYVWCHNSFQFDFYLWMNIINIEFILLFIMIKHMINWMSDDGSGGVIKSHE